MKVLVIGNGGREHALVWKLAQSPSISQILWAPGNPAVQGGPKVEVRSIPMDHRMVFANLAQQEKVGLTVVGPEGPLVAGISDEFYARGLTIFGPSRHGAQLEGSKVFSKRFFIKHGVPTSHAEIFSDFEEALAYSHRQSKPLVIKADGLAAGKGVTICHNDAEVKHALYEIMVTKVFGESGKQVLIEECLSGPEVSIHAITDGKSYQLLTSVQDHKRIFDGDQGPNTGGMGAYSPASVFTPEIEVRVRKEIFDRTLAGFQTDGISYCGVLYAGLILTSDGPKILEYNCRFGDPETQVILTRLQNDLASVLMTVCQGNLASIKLQWKLAPVVCVILAAKGYPGAYREGDRIAGLEMAESCDGVKVFHAGTNLKGNEVVTAGGRVLGVTACGKDLREAVTRAYNTVGMIQFKDKYYRRDIAAAALNDGSDLVGKF